MVQFKVDFNSQTTVFPHYWEKCIGSCHAIMAMREDYREHLRKARAECGFQYLRFHGLLDDAMSIVSNNIFTGEMSYSFINVDRIFDFLLEIGMKPFVELGFMPSTLASGSKTCFHYKANVTMPKDMKQWENLIEALVLHLIDRYGAAEVSTWFFEVWNEPNLKYFFAGTQEDYFRLYQATANVIKKVEPGLRVGGPATSADSWIKEIIAFCRETGTPLDFITTHHYPSDDPFALKEGTNEEKEDPMDEIERLMASPEVDMKKVAELVVGLHKKEEYIRGMLTESAIETVKRAEGIPVYYTEWNGSIEHDTAFQAAFVTKTLADNAGLVHGYSFWTFSDIFEEMGLNSAPFSDAYGMLTVYGTEKPVYHIFKELHTAGYERLPVEGTHDTVEVLATKNQNEYTVFITNGTPPGNEITEEEVTICLSGNIKHVIKGVIDSAHTNPKGFWEEMGAPVYPDGVQLAKLREASKLQYEILRIEWKEGKTDITFRMEPQSTVILKIR